MPDPIHHPTHYTNGAVECIDAIRAATEHLNGYEGYLIGNIIKYAWRFKFKNGAEDIRKAENYCGMLAKYEAEREAKQDA